MKAILNSALAVAALAALAALSMAPPALAAPAPFASVPDDSKTGPALPEGQLRPVSLNPKDGAAFFLVEETVQRQGDEVDFWTLMMFEPAKDVDGQTVRQVLLHFVLNCSSRTYRQRFLALYGDEGPSLAVERRDRNEVLPLGEKSAPWYLAQVLCDGDEEVKDRMMGDAEALEAAKSALAGN